MKLYFSPGQKWMFIIQWSISSLNMKLSTHGTNGYVVSLKMFKNIQYRALCSVAVSILYLRSIKQNEKKRKSKFCREPLKWSYTRFLFNQGCKPIWP